MPDRAESPEAELEKRPWRGICGFCGFARAAEPCCCDRAQTEAFAIAASGNTAARAMAEHTRARRAERRVEELEGAINAMLREFMWMNTPPAQPTDPAVEVEHLRRVARTANTMARAALAAPPPAPGGGGGGPNA